jgi:hypothetical protein
MLLDGAALDSGMPDFNNSAKRAGGTGRLK